MLALLSGKEINKLARDDDQTRINVITARKDIKTLLRVVSNDVNDGNEPAPAEGHAAA